MLKRAFLISVSILSIIVLVVLINLSIITKKDIKEFEKITQKNSDFKSQTAYQKRKNVKKDLYILDNTMRNHYMISSDGSEIFLNKKNQKYELIENLSNIKFLSFEYVLQDLKINQIKEVNATKGIYFFPTHKLILQNIDLSFFNTKDKLDPLDPKNAYFMGKAKELYFTINKRKPNVEVKYFDGFFNPKKGLKCEK